MLSAQADQTPFVLGPRRRVIPVKGRTTALEALEVAVAW